MNPVIIAAAVALMLSLATNAFLFQRTQDLAEDVATERANVATLQNAVYERDRAIRDLEIQRVRDEAALQRINDQMIAIERERHEEAQRYERYRSRLDEETIARPEVVGRAARIGISGSMRAVQCATGGGECDDDEPAPDTAAPVSGAGADNAGTDTDDAADSEAMD